MTASEESINGIKQTMSKRQRILIEQAMAVQPKLPLLVDPALALDPVSVLKIEDLIHKFKKDYTFVKVSHKIQQSAAVSDLYIEVI